MYTAQEVAAIGGNAMVAVTAHAGDGRRIGIHSAVRLSDQTIQSLSNSMDHSLMKKIDDLIVIVKVSIPARHKALSIYPLTHTHRSTAPTYLVLDEALATGRLRITEAPEGGSVAQLLAINDNSAPVLLLDGEELIGAKQNRILNLSIMLAPNSKTEIPVSCVEAGRWQTESHAFQPAPRVQFARGRAQKIDQVSRSLLFKGGARSDQAAVWDAIAAKSARMRVTSSTGAMAALFESSRDDLQGYFNAFPTSDGQVGAIYAIGNNVVGLEIFDSDTTFRKLARKLLASYALDAMEQEHVGTPPTSGAVRTFFETVCATARRPAATVGIGETVRLLADDVVGAALEIDGSCVHLAAFRRQAFEDQHSGQGLPRGRMSKASARARRW